MKEIDKGNDNNNQEDGKITYSFTEALDKNTGQSDNPKIEKVLYPKGKWYFAMDILLNLLIILVFVLLIRNFLIAPFRVSGSSMCDTLNFINGKCQEGDGEYIIVNKVGYLRISNFEVGSPKRGDIVVFKPPKGKGEFFIKRVIGMPGETIKLVNGEVFIYSEENPQGVEFDEPYLNTRNRDRTNPDPFSGNEFKVPEDSYFVMGDNRRQSNDSRHCFLQGGCRAGTSHFVPRENLEGRAWVTLWPLWKMRFLH